MLKICPAFARIARALGLFCYHFAVLVQREWLSYLNTRLVFFVRASTLVNHHCVIAMVGWVRSAVPSQHSQNLLFGSMFGEAIALMWGCHSRSIALVWAVSEVVLVCDFYCIRCAFIGDWLFIFHVMVLDHVLVGNHLKSANIDAIRLIYAPWWWLLSTRLRLGSSYDALLRWC